MKDELGSQEREEPEPEHSIRGGLPKGLSVCFSPILPVSHQPRDPDNVVLSLRDTAPSLKVPRAGSFLLLWTRTKVTCGCPLSIFLQAVPPFLHV